MPKHLRYSGNDRKRKQENITIEHVSGASGETVPSLTLLVYKTGNAIVRILIDAGGWERESIKNINYPTNVDVLILTHAHVDHCADLTEVFVRNPGIQMFVPERNKWLVAHAVQDAQKFKGTNNVLREINDFKKEVQELISQLESKIKRLTKWKVHKRYVEKHGKNATERSAHLLESIMEDMWWSQQWTEIITPQYCAKLKRQILGSKTPGQSQKNKILKKIGQLTEMCDKKDKRNDRRGNFEETSHVEERTLILNDWENERDFHLGRILHALDMKQSDIPARMADTRLPKYLSDILQQTIAHKKERLKEQCIVTPEEVNRAIAQTRELPLSTLHTVKVRGAVFNILLHPTWHIVSAPSTAVWLHFPWNKILFTGDIGNKHLWYPWTTPDTSRFKWEYGYVIMESTYGNRNHRDRKISLSELEDFILRSIREKRDIFIPILALERPVYVLYEFLQICKRNKINPDSLDIGYLGWSIKTLFHHFPSGSIKECIRPQIKEYSKPYPSLAQQWSKPRVIFAWGGFLGETSPAGNALEYMYRQDRFDIISPNYHGWPGSNGYNLFNGYPFRAWNEEFDGLKEGHRTYHSDAFSWHAGQKELAEYALKAIKSWGIIALNHGSGVARNELRKAIFAQNKKKKIRVTLPENGVKIKIPLWTKLK